MVEGSISGGGGGAAEITRPDILNALRRVEENPSWFLSLILAAATTRKPPIR